MMFFPIVIILCTNCSVKNTFIGLRRLKQNDYKFEASRDYTGRPCLKQNEKGLDSKRETIRIARDVEREKVGGVRKSNNGINMIKV
jgi:hypothetical protein